MTAPVVETAAPAAAPPVPAALPAVTPAAPPPAAPERVPETPTSEADLSRDALIARRLEAIKEKAGAPPVAPDGQSPDAPAGTPAPAAGDATPAAEPPAEEPLAAPTYIVVPVPEGHPLRQGGATEFLARNEVEARQIRGLLNDHIRRADVENLRTQVDKYERQVDKYERQVAEAAARQAAQEEWRANPEYAARMAQVQEVRDAFGDGVADMLAKGIDADHQQIESEKIDAALAEITERRHVEKGQEWIAEAWDKMTVLPAPVRALPQYNGWFNEAVQAFNAELGMGHFPQLPPGDTDAMHREFARFFEARIRAQPEIQRLAADVNARAEQEQKAAAAKAAAAQQERERIEKEGVDKFLKAEADRRRGMAPPNPLGSPAPATRDRTPAGSEAAAPVAAAPTSPGQDARQQAIESARRRAAALRP